MKTSTRTHFYKKFAQANARNIIVGSFLLLFVTAATAQRKWSFELRPGVNVATKKIGSVNLKTGFGLEGAFAYRFTPNLGAYAGWSWNKFGSKEAFAGSKVDFEETGYLFGLQFIHPIEKSIVSYMLKGGGIYNHIETENSSGKIINDTGHGLGWQIGGGLTIPLNERWLLTPEIRYRSLSRNINIGDTKTAVDLNYISAGVGLSFNF